MPSRSVMSKKIVLQLALSRIVLRPMSLTYAISCSNRSGE
jgi:hypothetical protein